MLVHYQPQTFAESVDKMFLTTASGICLLLFSASSVALDLSCSIIHSLPIGSERYNFNARHGTPVRSQQTYVEVCIIASVNLNSTDTEVTFPKNQHIELFYPSIPTIGSNFFRQLGEVTLNLELRKGNLTFLTAYTTDSYSAKNWIEIPT
ncbi:uncharacterized protein LOC118504597 isoform X3 [Anopheles stephensi]|uniref:uncharacterized protein LOC118504597 isoform X3 n=1 Tax=Anopheles stephensi TaxID=30069 RepID=UPI0016589452|nr:uncharacterized protein LOC118504597 isoform X3 [Anopheles stephensi]